MVSVELTMDEYMKCRDFSFASAESQQRIEFGEKRTQARGVREIARDTMIGKMAEAAASKYLLSEYGINAPVDYNVYPRGEFDENDITINGWQIDIKSTRGGRFLLFEDHKLKFREKLGSVPDCIMMCRTPWDREHDRPKTKVVDLVGCISIRKLTDPLNKKVYRLKTGDYIPTTSTPVQTDNYAIRMSDLHGLEQSVRYMVANPKV